MKNHFEKIKKFLYFFSHFLFTERELLKLKRKKKKSFLYFSHNEAKSSKLKYFLHYNKAFFSHFIIFFLYSNNLFFPSPEIFL